MDKQKIIAVYNTLKEIHVLGQDAPKVTACLKLLEDLLLAKPVEETE